MRGRRNEELGLERIEAHRMEPDELQEVQRAHADAGVIRHCLNVQVEEIRGGMYGERVDVVVRGHRVHIHSTQGRVRQDVSVQRALWIDHPFDGDAQAGRVVDSGCDSLGARCISIQRHVVQYV